MVILCGTNRGSRSRCNPCQSDQGKGKFVFLQGEYIIPDLGMKHVPENSVFYEDHRHLCKYQVSSAQYDQPSDLVRAELRNKVKQRVPGQVQN